jgi:hypothetical protein
MVRLPPAEIEIEPDEGPRNFATTVSDDSFVIVIVGESPARRVAEIDNVATKSAARLIRNAERFRFFVFFIRVLQTCGQFIELVWPPYIVSGFRRGNITRVNKNRQGCLRDLTRGLDRRRCASRPRYVTPN